MSNQEKRKLISLSREDVFSHAHPPNKLDKPAAISSSLGPSLFSSPPSSFFSSALASAPPCVVVSAVAC